MAIEGIFGSIMFGKVLGGFRTFHQISRKYGGRFVDHEIHLSKPLTEYCGSELVEISMAITLNGAWSGDPNKMLSELHFYQEAALAASLIVGGRPMGPGLSLFVLRSLSETHGHWLKGGKLIHCDLDLEFREYQAFTGGLPGLGGLGQLARGVL